MDLLTDFDPSIYMTAPRTDVPGTIALGRQLLAAAPADLPGTAEMGRKGLHNAIKGLEAGFVRLQLMEPGADKRPVDAATDNTWTCIKSRLDPYTWLDEQRFPDAGRAQEISTKLFPSGLAFTQLEYGAQWAEANWRIKLIEDDGKLEADLRRLCGTLFVDELLFWHKEYAKMVGVVAPGRGAKAVEEPRPNLATLRRKAQQAVIAWQVQLVALHLAGHPGARAALRPTDEYRDKLAASGGPPPPRDPNPDPSLNKDTRDKKDTDPKEPGPDSKPTGT